MHLNVNVHKNLVLLIVLSYSILSLAFKVNKFAKTTTKEKKIKEKRTSSKNRFKPNRSDRKTKKKTKNL